MPIALQTRYQQPHHSPAQTIYPLSQQLHSAHVLSPFQALLLTIFNHIQMSVCFHRAHAVYSFLVYKLGATHETFFYKNNFKNYTGDPKKHAVAETISNFLRTS